MPDHQRNAKALKLVGMEMTVQSFWLAADVDGDKTLTKDEFFAGLSSALSDPDAVSAMLEAAAEAGGEEQSGGVDSEGTLLFELLDVNRDGALSRMEVNRGLKMLHRSGVPHRVTADEFFKLTDEDKDRKLSVSSLLSRPRHFAPCRPSHFLRYVLQ